MLPLHTPRSPSGALTLLAAALVTACASAQTPSPASPAAPAPAPASTTLDTASSSTTGAGPTSADTAPPAWLVSDDAGKTVTIALQVTPSTDGGSALINGSRRGALQVVVPLNWTVQWDWRSGDSTEAHSLVVMAEREKLPLQGGQPAFSNAMTRMVTAGLPAGQADRTTFTADQAGWFWVLCGVPDHALNGEYIGLRVDPGATTASVKRK